MCLSASVTVAMYFALDAIDPMVRKAWVLATHLDETARVVANPQGQLLREILSEVGYESDGENIPGKVFFLVEDREVLLTNKRTSITLLAKFPELNLDDEDCRRWNSAYMYGRVYDDGDGIVLQADIFLGRDGVSRSALRDFFIIFSKLIVALEEFQPEESRRHHPEGAGAFSSFRAI